VTQLLLVSALVMLIKRMAKAYHNACSRWPN